MDAPDLMDYDQMLALCGEEVARRLARNINHVALNGGPCEDGERLADLVTLLEMEGDRS